MEPPSTTASREELSVRGELRVAEVQRQKTLLRAEIKAPPGLPALQRLVPAFPAPIDRPPGPRHSDRCLVLANILRALDRAVAVVARRELLRVRSVLEVTQPRVEAVQVEYLMV